MARKKRAEANLRRVISENFEGHPFESMRQQRTSPHKWVVKTDHSTQETVGAKQVTVPTYVVVGLNHAGYMATIALRTKDKSMAVQAANLLNKRIVENPPESS